MLDAVILSDIHLGSDNCQAKRVVHLLEQVADGELPAERVISVRIACNIAMAVGQASDAPRR